MTRSARLIRTAAAVMAALALAAVVVATAGAGAGRTDRSAEAPDARTTASTLAQWIPLPAGGNFNGIRWELMDGPIPATVIEVILQHNAACQWLRARRDHREPETSRQVVAEIPDWPAIRGTESAGVLKQAGDGGAALAGVLRDCDASHAREIDYATSLSLQASS